jgi:protoporphyrinogen oxidase
MGGTPLVYAARCPPMSTDPTASTRVGITPTKQAPVVVVGAGPAGLTAALQLAEQGVPVLVVEANQRVGGLAQTIEYKGYRFDIGGHRFFTKVAAVRDLWRSMLGSNFLRRPRLSRILFEGRLFDYPLKPFSAMLGLGVIRSAAILLSYLWAQLRPAHPETSFEDWVANRFGKKLYRIFFETYTEKVWGVPCRTISARWAAQRIQGLSLRTAIINRLAPFLSRRRSSPIKTLIDEFEYPRLGPGMMWEAFTARIQELGGSVLLNARVSTLIHDGRTVGAVEIEHGSGRTRQSASSIISTMPLTQLVKSLGSAPSMVQQAAGKLKYRDFITVAVIVDRPHLFPDNWIYVHDPAVKMGRIQNFKNWSPDMVPDPSKTCLGLEYFCTLDDGLWSLTDSELVALATLELRIIGVADPASILDAVVVRVPRAYPVYDRDYEDAVKVIREYVEGFRNLQTIGRNGTHTYNNQDHSMVMGILAARNVCGETNDLWAIDSADSYLEELNEAHETLPTLDTRELASTQPLVPTLVR